MNFAKIMLVQFYVLLSLFIWIGKGIVSNEEELYLQKDLKEQAFWVLRDKCNSCHSTKKRTDIFTLENMDSLALDIHKQVFVKKKMPKGRKIKLTDDERSQLKDWLDETLIEK